MFYILYTRAFECRVLSGSDVELDPGAVAGECAIFEVSGVSQNLAQNQQL